MLKGSFFSYEVLESESGILKVRVQLNKEHNIYEGHFPGIPIVPGVCQVQIVKEIMEEKIGRPLRLVAAKDIKFLAMINPMETDGFNCDIDYSSDPDKQISFRASLLDGEKKLLRIRATLV